MKKQNITLKEWLIELTIAMVRFQKNGIKT